MSWSVSRIGLAAAVREAVKRDLGALKCNEPEESVKNGVATVIDTALAAYPADFAVQIDANGSQYSPDGSQINSLSLSIKPLHGFTK